VEKALFMPLLGRREDIYREKGCTPSCEVEGDVSPEGDSQGSSYRKAGGVNVGGTATWK